MRNVSRLLWPATIAACGLIAACAGGGANNSSGSMTLSLTDAPVDGLTSVNVVFTGVELKPTNGAPFSVDFASPRSIDLLALQGGKVTNLFANQTVPVGHYDWVRLKVYVDQTANDASNVIDSNGQQYNLWIPSGAETGLKLVHGFTVAQGSMTNFLIDFNLRKSIVAPPGAGTGYDYLLKPALRAIDQMKTGTLNVSVDLNGLATAQNAMLPAAQQSNPPACDPALYLFVQQDAATPAVPDDVDGDTTDDGGSDPIYLTPLTDGATGGTVSVDPSTNTASVTIPLVDADFAYTISATCDASVDHMDTNDYNPLDVQNNVPNSQTMRWSSVSNVTLQAGGTQSETLP